MARSLQRVFVLFGLLAGCASDQGFRTRDADGDTQNPRGCDPEDETGGWGQWELGPIPDLAFVLGAHSEDGSRIDVVVADIRGRVLDTWTPPALPGGRHPEILDIHPVAPGRVLVVTGEQYTGHGLGGWESTLAVQGVWHGDLVSRSWRRVLHRVVGDDESRYVLDDSDRALPTPLHEMAWGLQVGPWAASSEHLLVSWMERPCEADGRQRVMAVSADGTEPERSWSLDRDWDLSTGDHPALLGFDVGASEDGEGLMLARVALDACTGPSTVRPTLVRWPMDGRPEVLGPLESGMRGPLLHRPSGAGALVRPPAGARGWTVSWVGAPGVPETRLDHDGRVRLVAPLDPDHGAALLALEEPGTATDDLIIVAGGREVWRIEALKEGLGQRALSYITGTVVAVP